MNSPLEMYTRLTEKIDPNDSIVADEIQRGIRHPYGVTDVHDHLPTFRAAAHGNVLEIGVRHGSSTSALLLGIEEHGGHLYSVDIEDCQIFQSHPQWTFIKLDSIKEAQRLKEQVPKELDLLFIDGDHSYQGVYSDLNNFGPNAKVIMLHDTSGENIQVNQAIADYLLLFDCRQKYASHSLKSHGLTILE